MRLWLAAAWCLLLLTSSLPARAAPAVDTFITAILDKAQSTACPREGDTLGRILCAGVIRVGVRNDYKSFGQLINGTYHGYEIDFAGLIAKRLGVRLQLVPVNPTNRIPLVMGGDIDMIIATMGHTVARDLQINFVRPHYYASPTGVVGPLAMPLSELSDVAGRTVCVPIGNFSNVVLSQNRARLMIFDGPDHLLDALRLHNCSLIAHDRALLVANVTGPDADPAFAGQYEEKISFGQVPWGIGVAEKGSTDFARFLGLFTAEQHASGGLVALAVSNHIDTTFLRGQQRLWSDPACIYPDGSFARNCLLDPVDVGEQPTEIAPAVKRFEAWIKRTTGWAILFPMLTGNESLALFVGGIVNSLILVVGAIAATLGIALLLQAGLRAHARVLRVPTRMLVTIIQCSPLILLLVLGYLLVTLVLTFSTPVALATAMMVIGLSNGTFAASAITEAAASLPPMSPLVTVLRRSSTQIMSFLVNAARASAVASFIGVPELLAALTDVTSFTSERRTTYTILLIFYMSVVMGVVGLSRVVTRRFSPQPAAAR